MYLRQFDPWKNEFCTCPPKYSLNPYTGCAHGCIYCYASSYIKDFFRCRIKKNLFVSLNKEITKIKPYSLISLCNTSDPYPPVERDFKITRECLEILKEYNMRVLIITKSDIVCRDSDLLKEMPSAVSITITSIENYKKLEPNAPDPFNRFKALEYLSNKGIPTALRLDPIIPFLNDEELEEILKKAESCGIRHVTSSTFKPRWDSWKRLRKIFPEIRDKLEEVYFKRGHRIGNSYYLNMQFRKEILIKVREICMQFNLSFSTCREPYLQLNTSSSCDGSHLIGLV